MSVPFFYIVLFAFSVWMIFDAIRRSAEFYWYLIILFLPFGAFIYFFFIKLRDYDLNRLVAAKATHPPLTELRHRVEESPSVENTLALADALEAQSRYTEAADIYRGILGGADSDRYAMHGLARCMLGMGERNEAVDVLAKLMEVDRSHADYSAALDYAEALSLNGQEDDATELLDALANVTQRINHRMAHAHYVAQSGDLVKAMEILDQTLAEHEHLSPAVRDRNAKWARKAKRMLTQIRRGTYRA